VQKERGRAPNALHPWVLLDDISKRLQMKQLTVDWAMDEFWRTTKWYSQTKVLGIREYLMSLSSEMGTRKQQPLLCVESANKIY